MAAPGRGLAALGVCAFLLVATAMAARVSVAAPFAHDDPSVTDSPSPSPEVSASASPGLVTPAPLQSVLPIPSVQPSPVPVQLEISSALIILGRNLRVHVDSPPSGILMLAGFDSAVVRAVFNPIDRTIDVWGLRTGATTITASDEYGLSATLAITVQAYAGKAYGSASVTITGDPASANFVAEKAADAAKLVAYPQPGARVNVDAINVRNNFELAPDNALTVSVPLSITGPGYAPYHQTVTVRVTNLAQPAVAPRNLLVSDFPETIGDNGTLFDADLTFVDPARLLYYHYAAPGSTPRRVVVKAQNNGLASSLLELISGIAGPDVNVLSVGHESTKRFLIHESAGEGEIFEVPPRATVNVVDQILPPGHLVSGIMQMRVVSGASVRVAVIVQNAAEIPTGPISETLLSSAVKHSRGIYRVPEFDYDVSYTVGDDPSMLLIGRLPLPNLVQGEVLGGDYGVKQSASLTLLNPRPEEARVGMWFEPRGGRATGTFLIDGQLVQLHPVEFGHPALVQTFAVPANGYRRLNIVTMPEGGSSYPVRVIFASAPPPNAGWNISPTVY